MHRYRHSGLTIASEIELPEWVNFACGLAGEPDIEIVLSDGRSPPFPADGSTFVAGDAAGFRVAGVGGWQVEGGRRITLYPSLAADPAELRLFTLGSAWGLLGYQRRQAMWHGSAVEVGGRAVLFCGDAASELAKKASDLAPDAVKEQAANVAAKAAKIAGDVADKAADKATDLLGKAADKLERK